MRLTITRKAVTSQPFRGIGAEADCFIFDEQNRNAGVTEEDLQLVERRLRAVAPGVARLFVDAAWFNPALDGTTFDWNGAAYANLLRQLRLLQACGTACNLVMFQPMPPAIADPMPAVRGMLGLIEHLRRAEQLHAVRWLTLYNEPDSIYPHDSPLTRRVFPERLQKQPPFSEYVRINRETQQLLQERGLYPEVRLLVADTVWGHPMRVERIRLCADAFADLDVTYSYHNYAAEPVAWREVNNPDFAYPGMAEEAQLLRGILGPERELMLWEFNYINGTGFGSHYPGIGKYGTDLLGCVDTGAALTEKVLLAAAAGVTGVCLWCLHDVLYPYPPLPKRGPMPFGLWRYKWENWYPRPYYHYYALLCQSFRPGCQVVAVRGGGHGVTALAATQGEATVLAVLNRGTKPAKVAVAGLAMRPMERLRVYPDIIPDAGDLPVAETGAVTMAASSLPELTLAPLELTILRHA